MPHTTHRPETLSPSSPMPEALRAASTAPDVVRVPAQTVGRILHVGPYADEARSLAAASEAVLSQGLSPAGPHIEVYLSDPRRVDPPRLRTIVMVETA